MPVVRGHIVRITIYEEEGRTDWALALSKICWYAICVMVPISLVRFVNDLFGPLTAAGALFAFLLLVRLLGPLNLVMLDELLGRIFPTLRSAIRFGRIRVHDFRVRQEDGRQVACLLRGDLVGGVPMQGDLVNLQGNYYRGTFRVRTGENHTTGSTIAPQSTYSGWILVGSIGLVAVFALYLHGVFDPWIYPLVVDLLEPLLEETS